MLKVKGGLNNKPIGIFDSGIGGLTVFKKIQELLPNENLIYFGDTARVPYGTKSKNTIKNFAKDITRYLKSLKVKAIVIACNTVSSMALREVKNISKIPVIDVIKPGSSQALKYAKKGILIIGTTATIKSKAYFKEISKKNKHIKIEGKACPLFVPLVEEGFSKKKVAFEIAQEYLKNFKNKKIDTLILGCTHYPLLKEPISKILPDVKIIDSSISVSNYLKEELDKRKLSRNKNLKGTVKFIVSDDPEKFKYLAKNLLNIKIEKIKVKAL